PPPRHTPRRQARTIPALCASRFSSSQELIPQSARLDEPGPAPPWLARQRVLAALHQAGLLVLRLDDDAVDAVAERVAVAAQDLLRGDRLQILERVLIEAQLGTAFPHRPALAVVAVGADQLVDVGHVALSGREVAAREHRRVVDDRAVLARALERED